MGLPRYFQIARAASRHSNLRCAVGAVIVSPKPVSIGFNVQKSHPRFADGKRSYSIHAEITALLKAKGEIRGGTIYVYREDRTGAVGIAKPCINCMAALIEAGIKRVYYTTGDRPYWAQIDL
jgi:deoxycytidylate deaminase